MWKNRWPIRINDRIGYADNSLMKKLFNKEAYVLEKRLQNIYDNIKRNLERIRIDSSASPSDQTDYPFSLKQGTDHQTTDNAILTQFQREFYNYLKSFQEDWKYFGINENGIIYFCFGRYGFFNKRIRCPSHLAIPITDLINRILSDIKEICKLYYQIELD